MLSPEVALGFTNTVDHEIIWNKEHLEQLAAQYGIGPSHIADHRRITSMEELLGSILFHFSRGTGCGMFVENQALIDGILSGQPYHPALGGTAVRAALVLYRLGCPALVHLVSINEETLGLLPPGLGWVCSRKTSTYYPHLTIQFPEGARLCVGGQTLTAPRANRVIYSGDLDNARLRIAPEFFTLAQSCKVIVLSSFDIVQSKTLLARRLSAVRQGLESLRNGAWVYYEDAHFAHPDFPGAIWRRLLPCIHMYGMNEEEFGGYAGRMPDLLSAEDVLAGLNDVLKKIPVPCLIVHTRYWALSYGPLAEYARSGLETGIAVASTRYRMGDEWTQKDLEQTRRLTPRQDAIDFAGRLASLATLPVAVCPGYELRPGTATTVGLGDSFVGGFVSALRHRRMPL